MDPQVIEELFRQYGIWTPESRAEILHAFYEWWDANQEDTMMLLNQSFPATQAITGVFFKLYLSARKSVQEVPTR